MPRFPCIALHCFALSLCLGAASLEAPSLDLGPTEDVPDGGMLEDVELPVDFDALLQNVPPDEFLEDFTTGEHPNETHGRRLWWLSISPHCVGKLGFQAKAAMVRSLKSEGKEQLVDMFRHFSAKAIRALANQKRGEYPNAADMAEKVAGMIDGQPLPLTVKDLTGLFCNAALGAIVRTFLKNSLGPGCFTSKSIAFGLGLVVEHFQLVSLSCKGLADLAALGEDAAADDVQESFFTDRFVRRVRDPIEICEECCLPFKEARKKEFILTPCEWNTLVECSYGVGCSETLAPMAESGIASFTSFCECRCCPEGEKMIEALHALPQSGKTYVFTEDMPERGDVTAIARSFVDWTAVNETHSENMSDLVCWADAFQSCVQQSFIQNEGAGCCDCGHWKFPDDMTLGQMFGADATATGKLIPEMINAEQCTAKPTYFEWDNQCPKYPDGSCEWWGGKLLEEDEDLDAPLDPEASGLRPAAALSVVIGVMVGSCIF